MINKIKKSIKVLRNEGFTSFIKKIMYFIKIQLRKVLLLFVGVYLFFSNRKELKKEMNYPEAIDFIFYKYFGYFRPGQIKEEIISIANIINSINPKNILEIGTSGGGTFFILNKLLERYGTIISVDMPGGDFGGDGYKLFNSSLYKSFSSKEKNIYLLREDSHSENTKKKVENILKDNKLDVLFIDGDHTYEGVKKDYFMYVDLVRKGGLIFFHDIANHPDYMNCKVDVFWNEVKQNKEYREFIKDRTQGWAGIGLITNN